MKTRLEFLLFAVGGCAVGMSAHAARLDSPADPYCAIAATNVFRLKSPPESDPTEPLPEPPLPKITVQGTTTILGYRAVLFKVTLPAKPPPPTRETTFVLREGQSAGEIEVMEINVKAGTVTFRNHGIEQMVTLE